jgi:hypothetical protein
LEELEITSAFHSLLCTQDFKNATLPLLPITGRMRIRRMAVFFPSTVGKSGILLSKSARFLGKSRTKLGESGILRWQTRQNGDFHHVQENEGLDLVFD